MSAARQSLVSREHLLYPDGVSMDSGQTELVISRDIPTTVDSSLYFSLYITVTDVVVGAGEDIKLKLQQFTGDVWVDVGDPQAVVKLVAGDGLYCIFLNSDIEMEAMVLPLTNLVRLVADSGATSSATVTSIFTYDRV